jgi:hypothetical protein
MAYSDEKTLPFVWMKNSPYYIATAGTTSRTPGFIVRKESHRLYPLGHGGPKTYFPGGHLSLGYSVRRILFTGDPYTPTILQMYT